MSRLIFPNDFISQVVLHNNIITQSNVLGENNPLNAFLNQQSIVLDDDAAAGDAADTHETNRGLLSRQSENYRQLRDNYFKTPWKNLTGSAQFLKQFYRGNAKELGNWGLTVTGSGKIKYPSPFAEKQSVFTAFIKKHNSYADGESPLLPYLAGQNINLANDAAFMDTAVENNDSFAAAARQSENEAELRDRLWEPVIDHIKAIGNFLMKLYRDNAKALGTWGFVVDDSPQKPKLRTTKLKLGEKITNKSVLIGSTLTNIGGGDLHLYKGSSTVGTPIIINKDEQFGIQKGYGTITVVNPSTLIDGKFTVMVSSS